MNLEQYLTEATTGMDAWRKHFQDKGELDTVMSKDSYLYGMDGKKRGMIEAGTQVTVLTSIEPTKEKAGLMAVITYQSAQYKVHFNKVQKPLSKKTSATELMRINADNLTQSAKTDVVQIGDKQVKVKVFDRAEDLAQSVRQGFEQNPLVPDYIKEDIVQFLEQSNYGTIDFSPQVTKQQKNELGKYLGEIIIGLQALKNGIQVLDVIKKSDKVEFMLPADPAFEGLDSLFLRKADGSLVGISSKKGVGAKASWFANILAVAVHNPRMAKSRLMKEFVTICTKYNLNPHRQGKEILYKFGFTHLLKGVVKDSETYKPYLDIKNGNETEDVKKAEEAVRAYRGGVDGGSSIKRQIDNQLPHSLTSFFSRAIADLLNKDKDANDDMLRVLGAKDFIQANLDNNKWHKGVILYKFVKSKEAKLTITGGKAAVSDINARQGMINYLLEQ
jgi:hypothetical protein